MAVTKLIVEPAGLLRVRDDVVIAPAALDAFVAAQHADLVLDERADLLHALGVAGAAAEHVRQGVDRVGVAPIVVHRVGRGAAERRQVARTSRPRRGRWPSSTSRPAAARLQQRRDAQRRHPARKAWWPSGTGRVNLHRPGASRRAPGAVAVLPLQEELDAAARWRASISPAAGGATGFGLGPISDNRSGLSARQGRPPSTRRQARAIDPQITQIFAEERKRFTSGPRCSGKSVCIYTFAKSPQKVPLPSGEG